MNVSHEFGHLLNKTEQLAEVTKGGGLLLLWIPAEQEKKWHDKQKMWENRNNK